MKDLIKKCSVVFISFVLIITFTLNTFAYIECDGNINPFEWNDVDSNILFEAGDISGCVYHSAYVKFKYIEEDRRVYLAVFLDNFNNDIPEDAINKTIISFNDSSEITLFSDLTADYNEDAFFLNFGYFEAETGGCTYEAEIVLKELEYDNILTLNIAFEDYNGDTSQTYRLNIKSEEFKKEEEESRSKSEKESEKKAKEEAKAAKKTSKRNTTKKKTTTTKKETTTEYKTAILTESYESYSETLEKNNNSILIIAVACVITSVCAMCIVLFRKKQ